MGTNNQTRSKRKRSVNPYFFFLAKRLAVCYYFGTKQVSDLQFVSRIYDEYKSKEFNHTKYVDDVYKRLVVNGEVVLEKLEFDSLAKSKARKIHNIVKSQDLFFTDSALNVFVQEIRVAVPSFGQTEWLRDLGVNEKENPKYLTPFNSWAAFVSHFKDDRGASETEELCRKKTYSNLSELELRKIHELVEYRCLKFRQTHPEYGHRFEDVGDKHYDENDIICNTKPFTIRRANSADYTRFAGTHESFFSTLKPERFTFADLFLKPYTKEIYVYVDEFGIRGYVHILPVKEAWFSKLLESKKIPDQILNREVEGFTNYANSRFVFIESIVGDTPAVSAALKFYLPAILLNLVGKNNDSFICFYLAQSKDLQGAMKHYSFEEFMEFSDKQSENVNKLFLTNGKKIFDSILL